MKNMYGLDTRSIAGFRVVLSLFIAFEFALIILLNFASIYSPETGILGNTFALEYHSFYKGFGGIFFIQSDVGMHCFIWLIIVSMLLLALGFYPKLMAFIGSVLLYLFFNRYSLLYFGWEMYASVMLFWLVIIPSHHHFSVFRYNDKNNGTQYEWRSPLAFALLFQIGFIYFYNGISKNGELWMSGRAIDSFLAEADKTTAMANWFLQFPLFEMLTPVINYAILFIEIGLLFLLFLPFKNSRLRYLASFLIFILHWGIAAFADVGSFKYVATAVSVLIVPGTFWDWVEQKNIDKKWIMINSLAAIKMRIQCIFKVKLPCLKLTPNRLREKTIAWLLCAIIVFSNISQTNASISNDRVKAVINYLHVNKFLSHINYYLLPQYSFFTQYWHLYSPDPPRECGYLQVEAITANNDTLAVFNGSVLKEDQKFASAMQHYFFNVLLLKKGRNQKERIAEKQLILHEIRLWNKNPQNAKLNSLQLVIHSRLFDKNKKDLSGFKRVVYKTVEVKYR